MQIGEASMLDLDVRPAHAGDAAQLVTSMFRPPDVPPSMGVLPPGLDPEAPALSEWLEHPSRGLHIARLGDVPIGAMRWRRASGERTRHKAAIVAAHVLRTHRRQGVAHALFESLSTRLRIDGVSRLTIWLPTGLTGLRDALDRRGAVEWGWEPDGLRVDGHPVSVVRTALAFDSPIASVARTG